MSALIQNASSNIEMTKLIIAAILLCTNLSAKYRKNSLPTSWPVLSNTVRTTPCWDERHNSLAYGDIVKGIWIYTSWQIEYHSENIPMWTDLKMSIKNRSQWGFKLLYFA